MKKINWVITLWCLILLAFNANAQSEKRGAVRGKIATPSTNQPVLEGAIISAINMKDSIVAGNAMSDKKGLFEIKDLGFGKYKLMVSFFGLKTASRFFSLSADQPLHKVDITLDSMSITLKEIEVFAEAPPVKIKPDTVEFNASSFKTRENAVVEDLLKKLPGVEVQADGTVSAHGQKITKIYVDGKPFFGNDPKIAMKNLPSFIIDKVQVIDKKSDKDELSNEDDGQKEKIINLTIRKDKKKGVFGRNSVGAGNDERYEGDLNLNRFNKDQQMNFMMNIGNNILGSKMSGGINYSDSWSKKVDFSGSYMYSNGKNNSESKLNRNNIIQDQSIIYTDNSNSSSSTQTHSLNFGVNYKDSLSSLSITPTLNFQRNNSSSSNQFESSNADLQKINDGSRTSKSITETPSFSNTMAYRKRFRKKGRSVSLSMNNRFDESNSDNCNSSISSFYQNEFIQNTINQKNSQERGASSNSIQLRYTEPVPGMKNKQLVFSYQYGNSIENSSRNAFDFNEITDEYDLVNTQMTNVYRNHNISNQYGVEFVNRKVKYHYNIGLSMRQTNLRGKSLTKDSLYKQDALSVIPRASFNYNLTKFKSLSFTYSGSLRQPSITDLQPLPDNSNPLYIRLGNPNLKPEYSNNINFGYRSITSGTYISINGNSTANKITYNSFFDVTTGKQTSRPENVSGNYTINGRVSFGRQEILGISVSPNFNCNVIRSINFVNQQKLANNNYRCSGGLNFDYRTRDNIELSINTNISYNKSSLNNTEMLNGNGSLALTYYLPQSFVFTGSMNYTSNSGMLRGTRDVSMLNVGVYKEFLKSKQARISLQGYDLLNQNSSITRTVSENLIEDRQVNVLQRYFLLSFTFRFNKFRAAEEDGDAYIN